MLLLSLLLLSLGVAQAQLITSTLPFEDGDTLLVSRFTNAAGAYAYTTLSTINGAGAAVTTTTRAVTTARTSATSATTQLRVVGQDATQSAVSTTFTFTTTNVNGDKVLRTSVFVPSFAPTGTPVDVPAGTIIDYSAYASTVQPALESQASARAALASATSGGRRGVALGMGVGLVGAVAVGAGGWLLGVL